MRVYGVGGLCRAATNTMKRSQINRAIADALQLFHHHRFVLPPFAHWTPEEWQHRSSDIREIRQQGLGWDVTDFHSGRFHQLGLTLFTLRNGSLDGGKPYAEKIMHVRQNQVTPFHCHARKIEDIIHRGGTGKLALRLANRTADGALADTPVTVWCDGMERTVPAGETLLLQPGESITLPPFLYHTFWAAESDALVGEVSSLNDDSTDNLFAEPLPRYPAIEEDEAPLRLLCTEYPSA